MSVVINIMLWGEIMGELYNPYPKLPKNIRQVGERDQVVKLYIEDYVNTYLKRLYPAGGHTFPLKSFYQQVLLHHQEFSMFHSP